MAEQKTYRVTCLLSANGKTFNPGDEITAEALGDKPDKLIGVLLQKGKLTDVEATKKAAEEKAKAKTEAEAKAKSPQAKP